jgi:hypothetical protein
MLFTERIKMFIVWGIGVVGVGGVVLLVEFVVLVDRDVVLVEKGT